MGLFKRIFGRADAHLPAAPRSRPDPAPSLPSSPAREIPHFSQGPRQPNAEQIHDGICELVGGFTRKVVGESYRQEALQQAAGGRSYEATHLAVRATLVPQPDNPADRNAIAVYVEGSHVGYLSRDDALLYGAALKPVFELGLEVVCNARLTGGWDKGPHDRGHFGIVLELAPPERLFLPGGTEAIYKERVTQRLGTWCEHLHVTEWWEQALTPEDRETIYQSVMHDEILSSEEEWGAPFYYGDQRADLFSFLAGKLIKGDTYPLAIKVLDYSSSLAATPLDKHLVLDSRIRMLYRERENPAALSAAIDACRQQIDISPQAAAAWPKRFPKIPPYSGSLLGIHRGFKQLSIVLTKEHRYEEALELCKRAQAEGWYGDWAKRIERLSKKSA